ncbi:hypothetical protein C0U44_32180, partial [Klebsiella pneumoniae]
HVRRRPDLSADSIRDEKVKVLKSLRRIDPLQRARENRSHVRRRPDLSADSIRDEKVKVLKSLRRIDPLQRA